VNREIAVELPDMVLCQRNCVIGVKDRLHDLGIASDLLLVAHGEQAEPDIRQQLLDLPIAKLGTFDTGRRTDALDRGDAAQAGQTLPALIKAVTDLG